MKLARGDVVVCVAAGDYGKPRPAVIVQSDFFNEHQSCTLLPLTSELSPAKLFRIDIAPTTENGLEKLSQAMVDKITTVSLVRIKQRIGRLGDVHMDRISDAISVWLHL